MKADKSEPNKKGAYCSNEIDKSSVYRIDESTDMSGYRDFRETENQFIDSGTREALSAFQKKESAILYFGYSSCPRCMEALPVMDEIVKANKQHILYIRTGGDKKELLCTPKQELEVIFYTKQLVEKDNQGEYQFYVSFAVVVKDGKAISGHTGMVDGCDAYGQKVAEKEAQELKKIYEDMSSAVIEQEGFMSNQVKQLTLSTLFLTLGFVLSFAFHSFKPQADTVFLPVHIPVLLCRFVYGPAYDALVGMLTPLLSNVLTGTPPLMSIGIVTRLELSTYDFLSGWMTKKLPLYPSLIVTMLAGRVVNELANLVLLSMARRAYAVQIFLTATSATTIPGIVLQLVMMPLLVSVVKKLEVRKVED